MYSTCLFCHSALGHNEAIEHFPVGRRLSFDAAKGRLWVVCRACERWNLTPIEDRWEAIEECERLFRDTKLRVSTTNIGLARVREGLELVRIGSPARPEMAAWRYGDQFGRRRTRHIAYTAGAVVAAGSLAAGVMVLDSLTAGFWGAGVVLGFNVGSQSFTLLRARMPRARVLLAGNSHPVILRQRHLDGVTVMPREDGWQLRMPHAPPVSHEWRRLSSYLYSPPHPVATLVGDDAMRVIGQLLPAINRASAARATVSSAVELLDRGSNPEFLLWRNAAADHPEWLTGSSGTRRGGTTRRLAALPAETRLALEMATHEERERRALEGELAVLETAWKEAEEIATISDGMLTPSGADEELRERKQNVGSEPSGP